MAYPELSDTENTQLKEAREILNGTNKKYSGEMKINIAEGFLPVRDGEIQYRYLDPTGKSTNSEMFGSLERKRVDALIEEARDSYSRLQNTDFSEQNKYCLIEPDGLRPDGKFSVAITVPDDMIQNIDGIHRRIGMSYNALVQDSNPEEKMAALRNEGYLKIAQTAFDVLPIARDPLATEATLYECLREIGKDITVLSNAELSEHEVLTTIDTRRKQGYINLAFEELCLVAGIKTDFHTKIEGQEAEKSKSSLKEEKYKGGKNHEIRVLSERKNRSKDPHSAIQRMNEALVKGDVTYADLANFVRDKANTPGNRRSFQKLAELLPKNMDGLNAEKAMATIVESLLKRPETHLDRLKSKVTSCMPSR